MDPLKRLSLRGSMALSPIWSSTVSTKFRFLVSVEYLRIFATQLARCSPEILLLLWRGRGGLVGKIESVPREGMGNLKKCHQS